MVAGVVLTTLTSVGACTQLVHGECQSLMGLDAQSAEAHGTCYKMLHNALYRLHLVDRCRLGSLLELKEIADEDWALLLVDDLGPRLKFVVVALTCGQLQLSDGLWVPSVLNTILAPCKLALVLQCSVCCCVTATHLMQSDSIPCNLL